VGVPLRIERRASHGLNTVVIGRPAGGVVRDEDVVHVGSKAIGARPSDWPPLVIRTVSADVRAL
jgi:hypothetical protein